MEIFLVLILGIALFDGAALLWGKDSTLGLNHREWQRRRDWTGFPGRR